MSPSVLIEELAEQRVTLWVEGSELRYRGPREVLTSELLTQLKANKDEIVEALAEEVVETPADVLSIAREVLPPLAEEGRVDLDELIQANAPPDRGRDLLVKRGTNKAQFFKGNWRE